MFSSNTSLPRLESVEIKDATLENVEQHQFCEQCDDSSDFHRDVEVKIINHVVKGVYKNYEIMQMIFLILFEIYNFECGFFSANNQGLLNQNQKIIR